MIKKEFFIENNDIKLHSNLYIPNEKNKFPALLLIHGFLSSKEEYGDLPSKLSEKSYVVLTFDFRGHGKSNGDRGYYTSKSHLQDSSSALNFLLNHENVDNEKFAVIGHSLGSIAASRLVTEDEKGKKARTCILLCPPRKFEDSIGKLEKLAYKILYDLNSPILLFTGKHLYLPYKYKAKDILLSPEAIRRLESKGDLQDKMPVANYKYMIEEINHEKIASKINIPTLFIVAKNDKLISNSKSKMVFDAINTNDKKYVEITNTGHSIMMDYSSDKVYDEIVSWLENKM
ncbi:MAG: alpha/beta hydrolase [Candidatus Sericytochromatia bacterium]|nr:MAG: alpha/beta hydrolase [Candidatus Sericytochromatia bacterium]